MRMIAGISRRWLVILACLAIGFSCALCVFKLAGAGNVITGHVLDDGRSVGGATVYIQTFRLQGAAVKLQKAVSRADGSFQFRVANWHDECEVYAWLPGKLVGAFSIKPDDALYGGSLQDIPVIVRLRPVAKVKVRVVDGKGKPVAGVHVGPAIIVAGQNSIRPVPAVFRELGSVTDSDGRAAIDSLPCVSYSSLEVDDPRYAMVEKPAETPEATELKIVVQPACHLNGQVTLAGRPMPGLMLRWHTGDLKVYGWVVTDRRGMFQIDRAPKGQININLATTGRPDDDYVLPHTQTVVVPGDADRLDVRLEKGTLVSFQVCDASGRPAVQARVGGELSNPPYVAGNVVTDEVTGAWHAQSTDQGGRTRIRLKPQRYQVHTSRRGNGFGNTQDVVVGEGPTQNVVLHTPPADPSNALGVKVIDGEGYPVRTLVWVSYEDLVRRTTQKEPLWTGQDGVTFLGQRMRGQRPLQMRAQCGNEFSDLVVPPKSGQVVLKLHHVRLGSVEGVVTDASGRPIEGAELQLDPHSIVPAATNTDICPPRYKTGPDGRFTFNGIYPGLETFCVIHAPGYADTQTADFTIVAGKTVRLQPVVLRR